MTRPHPTSRAAGARPRSAAALGVLLAASALLTSCGRHEPPVGPGVPPPPAATSAAPTSEDLVGDWVEVDDEGRRVQGPEAASLSLLGDGRFGGSLGCAPVWGDAWTQRDRLVRLGPVERGTGVLSCIAPEASWLESTSALRWSDGLLVGLGPGGRELGRLERATTVVEAEAAAAGRPPRRADLVGTWRSASLPHRATVRLAADGVVGGDDGCNRFGGDTWRLEGDRVVTDGDRVTTTAGCVDTVAWLSGADVLVWEAGALVALGPGGEYLGHLYRVP